MDFAFDTIQNVRPNTLVLTVFFWTSLQQHGYQRVKDTVKKCDLVNKDLIFIPIWVGEVHWALGVRNTINKILQRINYNLDNYRI